ncbi:MAG: hypothetical protein PHU49_08325 [Syntrophorhabdaceae bacterium]|nr:hypothetical protein [Syntrophorhabdaceae bacterium]MDD5244009.1 hypothetical protein [Syntrophorhabdaceae bacterium]
MSAVKVLKAQIKDELAKLQKLLGEASQLTGERPSSIHVRAGSSILHDFYTGLENVFHGIASTIDGQVPDGMRWHVDLLRQMSLDIEGVRTPVIKKETEKILEEYLRFRHLFRKRYGFELEWKDIKRLLKKLPDVYEAVMEDLDKVFGQL